MLRTKVKAGSITNLTDARYFAAWEVEWMGFNLDPASGAYVQPQTVKAIGEWIDGPKLTGEFNLQSADEIRTAVDMLELDAVQAGMFTNAATLIELQSPVPVIKEIVVEPGNSNAELRELFGEFAALAQIFLLDFGKNGMDWRQLKLQQNLSVDFVRELCAQYPVLLSLDFDEETLDEVLDTLNPLGLSFTGSEEEKVGFKSFEDIDDLFEILEVRE
jgi:phosphoribosylanthranilate isomerase